MPHQITAQHSISPSVLLMSPTMSSLYGHSPSVCKVIHSFHKIQNIKTYVVILQMRYCTAQIIHKKVLFRIICKYKRILWPFVIIAVPRWHNLLNLCVKRWWNVDLYDNRIITHNLDDKGPLFSFDLQYSTLKLIKIQSNKQHIYIFLTSYILLTL